MTHEAAVARCRAAFRILARRFPLRRSEIPGLREETVLAVVVPVGIVIQCLRCAVKYCSRVFLTLTVFIVVGRSVALVVAVARCRVVNCRLCLRIPARFRIVFRISTARETCVPCLLELAVLAAIVPVRIINQAAAARSRYAFFVDAFAAVCAFIVVVRVAYVAAVAGIRVVYRCNACGKP